MSLERWEDNKLWEQERNEIEIKLTKNIDDGYDCCDSKHCLKRPITLRIVGRCGYPGGLDITLCGLHDEDEIAFDIYRRTAHMAGVI